MISILEWIFYIVTVMAMVIGLFCLSFIVGVGFYLGFTAVWEFWG